MKNSVKNYSVFIVFMLIVVGIITFCVFYVFGNVESENYSFGKDGYALYVSKKDNYQTKSYSFNSGSTYSFKNNNSKITIDSIEDGNVNIDDSTMIHYSDNSLLVLKKVVGMDLSKISDEIIYYYNIYKNTEIKFDNAGYQITSTNGNKVNFSNMLIRINENKYLFVSDSIRATIGKDEVVDFGNYVYIEYTDGEVVHIYSNTKSHQSIANELSIVSGDITINMKDKTIAKEGKKYITLSNLVIDSNANIDLIPQEANKLPSVNKPNVDTNISGGGVDVENNGSINDSDNNVNEEVVEDDDTVKQPVYKVVNMVVTPIKLDAEIEITDEDSIITSPTEVSVVNNSTLEVVYESSIPAGDTSAFVSTANLLPDTEYTIYAKSTYKIEDIEYERTFVNKIFRTEAIGVSFKKSYATSSSLVVAVNRENYSDVTSSVITIYRKDGSKLDYQAVDFSNGNKAEVVFSDLDNNTEYKVVMSDIQCEGVTVEDGYSEEKTMFTLKEAPSIGKLNYLVNKRSSTFELSMSNVVDNDYGIKGYRYEIFRVDQDMTKELPILTFETKDLKTVSVNVDENNLNRGSAYTYRVVVEFYDNEKTIEYVKELGSTMQLDGVKYPTIRFEETFVTWEQINGTIIIDDKYDTISGDDYRVVYKNSVEEYQTYTIISSTSEETIPIAINDLRANETYTFQVYADIDLKDDNPIIDEAYIGSVIVQTDEKPKTLHANFSSNVDYSSAFSINMRLSDMENEDAKLEASTISGMTLTLYQGGNTSGQVEIWKKVVDLNDSAYVSTIKEEFYDTQKLLNPAYFNALNTDFSQKTYTLKISDVYDYTKYKNQIPIDNDTYTFNVNSYVPEVPSDSDDAIKVTKILNKTADGFGLTYDNNLQPNTLVGYNLVANYPNDALNAMNLIYHVWVYNPATQKFEILPELDRVLPYDKDGNVSNTIYQVGYGTENNVFDTDSLRRGNKYYFTYEVELDLDGDGVKEPVNYPAIHGEDIVLKSPDLEALKELPLYETYPSVSNNTSATWKYKVSDVDKTLETNKLFSFVGNNTNPASSPNISVNNTDFSSVAFSSLKSGDFYSIKSQIRTLKGNPAIYSTLSSQYLHPLTNSLGLNYEAEVDSNTLIVRILNPESNEEKINKIASVDVSITPPSDSNLEVININGLTLNNGVAFINLINYPDYMSKDLTVGMKAYFDSGNTGFDVNSKYKAIQVLGLDAGGNYFNILKNKFVQTGVVVGGELTATFDPVAKLISATNKANASANMNVTVDERGVLFDGNTITFKELKEETLTSSNNVVSFDLLVPSISLVNPTSNKLNITPLLTSALFKTNIEMVKGVKLENNLIYVELYETDDNGLNSVKINEISNIPDNLASFEIKDLTPQKNYMVKFYTKIEVSPNVYKKYYLYDDDTKVMGQEYNFHTLSNVGIDNIDASFIINSYEDKDILISYTLENIIGFKHIKYNLYEYVEGEFELMDIEIPYSTLFNDDMSISLDAKPGNEYGFAYGKTYKIEIIPIGVYQVDGADVEVDLGTKVHVFSLDSAEEAQISITGTKNATSITYRVNIMDTSKIISNSEYSVKLKSVSDDVTMFEKTGISVKPTTDRYVFDISEYDLKDGENYMLVVSYRGDFNNSKENLTYKDKTKTEKFGAYVSLGAVTATANQTDPYAINIVFADSYLLETVKKIDYTVSSTTTDYFSASSGAFTTTYNTDTNIYVYKLKVDSNSNFKPGNVYIITMNFSDAKGKLIASEEVSYYYAAAIGGGE